jgi:hypothetical protein
MISGAVTVERYGSEEILTDRSVRRPESVPYAVRVDHGGT